jgi:uncharacterized protein (TIGR02001 family)
MVTQHGNQPGKNLEIDSYAGFKQPFDQTLGYEVGIIHYSYPEVETLDSQELFGGLTLLGSRFGVALSNDPDKQNSTLFADLGGNQPFGIGISMKYTTHQLNAPVVGGPRLRRQFHRLVGEIVPPLHGHRP